MRSTPDRATRGTAPLSMTPLMVGYLVLAVLLAIGVRFVG